MSWTGKPTITSGIYPTGLDLEAMVDQIEQLNDAEWINYVPAWTGSVTNPVIGNGTITGRYRRPDGSNLVVAEIRIAMGSTTTYGSGFWGIGLGVTPSTASSNGMVQVAVAVDNSTGGTNGGSGRIFGGVIVIGFAGSLANATVPFTWATADELRISAVYEPAA